MDIQVEAVNADEECHNTRRHQHRHTHRHDELHLHPQLFEHLIPTTPPLPQLLRDPPPLILRPPGSSHALRPTPQAPTQRLNAAHSRPDEASPAAAPEPIRSPAARELTVVRIPLRSAKHHFGAHNSRGQRKYNEDTNQAGTIDLPAFARRVPVSLSRSSARNTGEGSVADSKSSGDPQIFYFGVFDGHGGTECSEFLRDELHGYIEDAAVQFGLGSSLRRDSQSGSANSSVSGGWVSGDEGTDARQHDDKKRGWT
ncbi:hypothetical protein MCOR02_007109 [Pyricularia oryzae]|nr:hypothetical protein MCOR02_007109 [Pyricularia oryzae]